ncbi:MAG: hypothetical protein ACYCO5_06030 [Acidobacteriaceae bacterium]
MLSYLALESNSEAAACDIAAYLNDTTVDFANPPAGAVCALKGGTNTKVGVVVLPFDQSALANFNLWRVNMEIMADLRHRAAIYCPESSVVATGSRGVDDLTPAGSALSIVKSAIGLFATQGSLIPVGGTIQDQAFMDAVARQLRTLNISVLMPSTYSPYALTAVQVARSPFLTSLDKLLRSRACLAGEEAKSGTTPIAKFDINQLNADIDSYMVMIGGGTPTAKTSTTAAQTRSTVPDTPTPTATGTTAANPSSAAPATSTETSTTATPPARASTTVTPTGTLTTASPLQSILSADNLAQKLGVNPTTGDLSPSSLWQHILLIKALESGGTIVTDSNILHTRIRYSGGSVGTFTLLTLDGEVECSANVYDYGGSIPAKKFQDALRHYKLDPSKQYVFERGNCRAVAH